MAPSGNPYLGPTPVRNLFVNAGHGTWADHVVRLGRAVADMVAGRVPEIDMDG
jgi:D-amino-acid dehydrogenase